MPAGKIALPYCVPSGRTCPGSLRGPLFKECFMLRVNLAASEQQIAGFITGLCVSFGKVMSVKIHRLPLPFALVEMSSPMQTQQLTSRLGDSAFGTVALVRLAHET